MLADGFDGVRVMAWRDRCAIAFAAQHAGFVSGCINARASRMG